MEPARLTSAIPVLLSKNIPATVRFYEEKLGFTCPYVADGFAILERDGVILHFTGCDDQKLIDWSSCRIEVRGVDVLYQACVRHEIVHPHALLEDTEYGTREFGMVDLHGVLITFFERRPDGSS